ncbi:MAG: metallophosphoesterase [Anaeromyxobacteraceae bacterium]
MPARFGRRHFLGGAATIAAAGALGAFPRLAEADGRAVRPEHVTFLVPGLDPAHDGLKVAQLSDVHVGPRTPAETVREAIDLANAFEPDLVVLTGDYVCHHRREVDLVRELLGGLEAPTFAVLGNHDVWVDPAGTADALRGCGHEVLENAWTEVSLRGAPLRLVGIGDRMTHRDDVERAVRGLPAGGSSPLVLAHGPKTADRVRALGRPALCLSGHTHGGQINLPIVTPILFAAIHEPYVRGRYRLGDVQLYVNRGVGMSGVRVRVNAPPEVTLATLRAA